MIFLTTNIFVKPKLTFDFLRLLRFNRLSQQILLVVGVIVLSSVYESQSAAVRVRVANNPYLYEIARPLDVSESRAIPVHPVRGFQAEPSETRSARTRARSQSRAELRAPPPTASNRIQTFGAPTAAAATEEVTTEPETQKPYKIQYDSVDANGTQQRREETKDDKGVVRGSYR